MTICTVKFFHYQCAREALTSFHLKRAQEHNRSKSLAAFLYDDGEPDAEGRQAKLNDGNKKEKALIQKEKMNLIDKLCNDASRPTLDLVKKTHQAG